MIILKAGVTKDGTAFKQVRMADGQKLRFFPGSQVFQLLLCNT